MIEDFVITKELPVYGLNKIQNNKDGQILIRVKNGFILLNTNENWKGKPNSLSDIFTISRLGIPYSKYDNFFKDIVHEGLPRIGENRTNSNINDSISISNVSISESGVSKNLKCLFLSVTDTYNGIIFNYENGSFNIICSINKEIAKIENINTDLLLSEESMSKLRINYLVWIKSIKFKYLKDPIWPLVTSSLFLCFTETSEIWVYKYDCFSNKISRVFSINFNIDYENGENILYCEQGEWRKSNEENEEEELKLQIIVVTTTNKIIIKEIIYNIERNEWEVNNDGKILKFQDFIINFKIFSLKDNDLLSILFHDKIEIYLINKYEEKIGIELNNIITMDNFIQFKDSKDDNLINFILSNRFGDLIYFKFNFKEFKIIKFNKFNYQEFIESNELPIFGKLNNLNSINSFLIDSINIDITGNFIYMIYSPNYLKSNFEFCNHKKDDISLSIINCQNEEDIKIKFNNRNYFNSILSTPLYWKSINNLLLNFKSNIIKEEGEKEEELQDNQNDNLNNSLLSKLFLNSKIENERIINLINEEGINKEFKDKIRILIANEILKLFDEKVINIKNDEDMFIYFQYCKLLNKNIPDKSICKLKVYGKNCIIYESFDVSTINIGKCIKDGGIIQSIEGHYWKLCDITLLPILSPIIKRCSNCKSIKVGDGEGAILEKILSSTPICPFCGGRYV